MPEGSLTLKHLRSYQLSKLRETIRYAKAKSPFYSARLSNVSIDDLTDLPQISQLPFTTASDLREDPGSFLTLPPHEIARIVTLRTSGTTGRAKRLFFTGEELEHTIDFFSSGMSTLVVPGEKVLILLPGDQPDSVGDLLARGLKRIGVEGVIHGPVTDVRRTVEEIVERRTDCLVGIPTQVLALARSKAGRAVPRGMIKSVLLSTDHIPEAIVNALTLAWRCRVFKHYGITEAGLGAAVDCIARNGYHMREADLLFEIVDPETGMPLVDGETGEIVVTTLTRKGMPLIRYRTGDLSRVVAAPCPCGSVTKRLAAIRERLDGRVVLADGNSLTIADLDEALFRMQEILDYTATLATNNGLDCLEVSLYVEGDEKAAALEAQQALKTVPSIASGISGGSLQLAPISISDRHCFTTGVAKRKLVSDQVFANSSGQPSPNGRPGNRGKSNLTPILSDC